MDEEHNNLNCKNTVDTTTFTDSEQNTPRYTNNDSEETSEDVYETLEDLKDMNEFVMNEWKSSLQQFNALMKMYEQMKNEKETMVKKLYEAMEQIKQMKETVTDLAEKHQQVFNQLVDEKSKHAETLRLFETQTLNKVLTCRCEICIENNCISSIRVIKEDELNDAIQKLELDNKKMQTKIDNLNNVNDFISTTFDAPPLSMSDIKEIVNGYEDMIRYELKNTEICYSDAFNNDKALSAIDDFVEEKCNTSVRTVIPIIKNFRKALNRKASRRTTICATNPQMDEQLLRFQKLQRSSSINLKNSTALLERKKSLLSTLNKTPRKV
ncbi:hypothetical protein EIN_023620 [Entamoeba invadens IP1]|uniref:hypothetical protein n=1 Tax=Entamoeba invadens IP1 TaxID=370355 RepID=UPI0002C3D3CF|nr:hypothetical protein EIN_023620 [Entamoeba invadens IP1]ELP90673.1 hypothetical protein EIN_023620 [Entamoeba invadens IP1]|eukprot:XP_004257444.1 hypothetical protein EIN_023620 [Entamoeba invadens IP1]